MGPLIRHALLTALALVGPAAAAQGDREEAAPPPEPFLRLLEEDEGRTLRLELAVRSFTPIEGEGPELCLAAAMHIGEPGYYGALQELLDSLDRVLYEGVKPSALGPGEPEEERGQAARIGVTERRIRFTAVAAHRHRRRTGDWPGSLDELLEEAPLAVAHRLREAVEDGWERRLLYAASGSEDSPIEIWSLGADGQPGGEAAAADLALSDQSPLKEGELEEERGIQRQLADALGLVFQLDVMDHSGASWRNSDMSVDQLRLELEEAGVDADELFGMLSGSSIFSKLAGGLIDFIAGTRTGGAALRIMGVEMLARSDELMSMAPGELGSMMAVLIRNRNQVVVRDLAATLESEPELASIGILYGAGHMPDLQQRITSGLGYAPSGDRWLPAVTLHLDQLGLPLRQVQGLRRMIGGQLDLQIRLMQRMSGRSRSER